jgi:imidazolonepropionase-like amidohydrolase
MVYVWLAGCSEPVPPGYAITDVTVIDAVNGVRERQTVVFTEDQIVYVGESENAPAYTRSLEGSGRYLIPGLWDFHVHLTYEEALVDNMSKLFLAYGITSVRDTGGLMHKVRPVVDRMRAPDALAPRVYFAGPLLDGNFVVYDGDDRPEIGSRNPSPEDAQRMIASLNDQGVDFIKIYELVSPEVFYAMVEAARQLDLPIDSHVPLSLRARDAGALVDSMEHLRNVELDCTSDAPALHEERMAELQNLDERSGYELRSHLHRLQRLAAIAGYDAAICSETLSALGTTLQVPTLRLNSMALVPPYLRDGWAHGLSMLPSDLQTSWEKSAVELKARAHLADTRFAEWSLFLTGLMHEHGVPIGAGTDTPIGLAIPGFSLHSELQMLVSAGLDPMDALRAATVRPAEFFGISEYSGAIAPGMLADMVLLTADPLQDIAHTLQIEAVISKGIVLDAATLGSLRSQSQ